jgi:hypothetical protein
MWLWPTQMQRCGVTMQQWLLLVRPWQRLQERRLLLLGLQGLLAPLLEQQCSSWVSS